VVLDIVSLMSFCCKSCWISCKNCDSGIFSSESSGDVAGALKKSSVVVVVVVTVAA